MLLARDASGDRERAAGLLRDWPSRAPESSMGMRALEQRAETRLAQAAPQRPVSVDADQLTVREMDVLKLLAIGRSNAYVAMVLEISLNTVATHVRNILAKTGCANRTEAAAYAMRHAVVRRLIINDEPATGGV